MNMTCNESQTPVHTPQFNKIEVYVFRPNIYDGPNIFTGIYRIDRCTVNISYRCVWNSTPPKHDSALWHYLTVSEWSRCCGITLCCVCIPTRIFYRGISGFVNGRPWGIWGCRLTTCSLYDGQFLAYIFEICWFVSLIEWKIVILNYVKLYMCVACILTWLLCNPFPIDPILTLSNSYTNHYY